VFDVWPPWRPCKAAHPIEPTCVLADATCPALPHARNGGAELTLTIVCPHCPAPARSPSLRSQHARAQTPPRPPWQPPSEAPSRHCHSATSNHHDHSQVYRRLCLVEFRTAHTTARVLGHRSTPPPCSRRRGRSRAWPDHHRLSLNELSVPTPAGLATVAPAHRLYRRRALPPAVVRRRRPSATEPPAHVARRPWSTSSRDSTSLGCGWASWCSCRPWPLPSATLSPEP
jgi:hypothetical protein